MDEAIEDERAEEVNIFEQNEGVDWLLARFVAMADIGLHVGLTLSVGGQQISGTLIGGRAYFEKLGGLLESANFSGMEEGFSKDFAKLFSDYKEIYPEISKAKLDSANKPSFIHLSDALYFLEGNPLTTTRVLWRGKLSEIDGFSLGSMTIGESR